MRKTAKRFMSILLILSMLVSMFAISASAETTGQKTTTANASDTTTVIDLGFSMSKLMAEAKNAEVDEDDPTIVSVEEELRNMTVLNADGESVPLTDEQIQTILYLYQQYLNNWAANANILGVQTPFFLQYNDTEDGLGALGEMLVLGGNTVDQIRNGELSYDDITGMIQTFLYADALGVNLYGEAVTTARDEILALIEKSGALTEAQQYLVINNWLAQNCTFDMEYIMNAGKEEDEKQMIAESPEQHEYYDIVYQTIYEDYKSQIRSTFEQQIRDGLEAEFKAQYYQEAIRETVYQLYLAALSENTETPEESGSEESGSEESGSEESGSEESGSEESGSEDTTPSIEDQASAMADQFMIDNADAIAEDPENFCRTNEMLLTEAPVQDEDGNYVTDEDGNIVMMPLGEQLIAGWDVFWADAQENGVEVDPVNYPGYKMTVDEIVAQQMDTPQEDPQLQKYDEEGNPVVDEEGNPVYMTPNEAIPVYAEQAAAQLTDAVLNYWQGSHFGALGRGSAVCLGYTKAFTYLTQCLHSDIYTTDGDIDNAESWKTAKELYYTDDALDVTKDYAVDCVRISFAASVTMYGETQDNFNSDHFWNAVQIDGQWYYIDPCYVDTYTEVMIRDRVETDGQMNHLYFLFSHGSAVDLYEGNYSEIKTLYGDNSASPANSTNYEDSWISRIKSNIYFADGNAYYVYDSTDMLTLMEEYENNSSDASMDDFETKLVYHQLDTTEANDQGDTDYTTLIEFNYLENEDDEESVVRVRNAEGGMEENEMLTALYADHEAASDIYPSLAITCALYDGKLYFNLDTSILCYDLTECTVTRVKEYNTVHGLRDDSNPFGGMAFSVVDSADSADFTVYNHPIAGISLKNDGNLYVSIATNFAFISGKESVTDHSSYGYEYEESNFNPDYSSYTASEYENNDMYESMGYEKEINDNDEFMWSANFVDTLSMSELAGTDHTYEEVGIDATCRHNAYTENRCADCGAIEDGTRVEDEGTAHAHHYVYFYEKYYTKDDNGNVNKGSCYVCTECGFSIEEPTEPKENSGFGDYGPSYEEQMAEYEKEKAIYDEAVATAGHTYVPVEPVWSEDYSTVTFSAIECSAVCPDRHDILDCLLEEVVSVTLAEEVTAEAGFMGYEGDCTEGLIATYQATGKVDGYEYTATIAEEIPAVEDHTYEDGVCTICGAGAEVVRVYGETRVETAINVAEELKENLGIEQFETIILANGDESADALSGTYLAAVKKAPILLYRESGKDTILKYIKENLTAEGTVYMLGGAVALPETLDSTLEESGFTVTRLAGATRVETNLAILEEAGTADKDILVCAGDGFADSLSASAVKKPILLVRGSLTDAQKEFLEAVTGNIVIIGGEKVISAEVEAELSAYADTVERLAGENRFETSVMVAEKFFTNPKKAVLAYAWDFPDGLCGGSLAASVDAPLILAATDSATAPLDYDEAACEYVEESGIAQGYVLGGDALISDETVRGIFNLREDIEIILSTDK